MQWQDIYIDGAWVRPEGRASIEVINPATEEAIATIPACTAADAMRAVDAAAAALEGWSQTSVEERAAVFRRLARLAEARADEITRVIVSEVGQPISGAKISQTKGAVEELDLIADLLPEIEWEKKVGSATVRRIPAGVVGSITAWNAPLRSVISKAGAAIAAGCTTVVKGSELAPLTSFIFAEIVHEAGVPKGVFNLVSGTGTEVGEAIVTHPLVDMVSLTGSVRAGRRVMELAAQDIKRVHLELGGKSANIILDDADLERALSIGIEDAYRNAGQVCGGLTRILVPSGKLAEAEAIAMAKARSFVLGDPFDPATTLGPVKSAVQRDRVRELIRAGRAEGARLLTGGDAPPAGIERGFYVQPTVFSGDNSMRIARDEVFGPVVVIIPHDGDDDAVRIANDSVFGLAGGVWSASDERARAVARRIRTGRVRINGGPLDKRAPHGGLKLSGIGREWGAYGIEEFTEFQSLMG